MANTLSDVVHTIQLDTEIRTIFIQRFNLNARLIVIDLGAIRGQYIVISNRQGQVRPACHGPRPPNPQRPAGW